MGQGFVPSSVVDAFSNRLDDGGLSDSGSSPHLKAPEFRGISQ